MHKRAHIKCEAKGARKKAHILKQPKLEKNAARIEQ